MTSGIDASFDRLDRSLDLLFYLPLSSWALSPAWASLGVNMTLALKL